MRKVLLLAAAAFSTGCGSLGPKGPDPRDFAVTTCEVSPNLSRIASERAQRYLRRHSLSPEGPHYLAVEVDAVMPGDVQDLWNKLRASQTSASAFSQFKTHYVRLWCVVLVDREGLRVMGNQGYVLNDTPSRGRIANMGGHQVLYVGTGF
jgi:hypothetical protein